MEDNFHHVQINLNKEGLHNNGAHYCNYAASHLPMDMGMFFPNYVVTYNTGQIQRLYSVQELFYIVLSHV